MFHMDILFFEDSEFPFQVRLIKLKGEKCRSPYLSSELEKAWVIQIYQTNQ